MTRNSLRRNLLLSCSVSCLLLVGGATAFADCPEAIKTSDVEPLHLLVLGDSIMWGQGLRDEEKFSTRVKCWLQAKTEREVKVHVEAHSGAVISAESAHRLNFLAASGEVNLTTPTINEELDHAAQFYQEQGNAPALILLNGCINDVGVKKLLAASTPLDDVRAQASKSCGDDMYSLLQRTRKSFPLSYVFVTGYYPIVSLQTADNVFLRLLVKKLNSAGPDVRRLTDKEMRARLIALSDEWYKTSTASLSAAVERVNASATGELSTPRVNFVEIQFGPEHVFAAPDTLLWNFMFASTNLTGFTKAIVLLSFGTAAYKTNDHMRESRIRSCEETFKKPREGKEPKDTKEARQDLFLICRYASLGHPNQMGALIYAEAIKGRLQQLLDQTGWKRATNRTLSLH